MQKTENQFKVSFSSMAIAGAGFAVGMAAVKGAFALVQKTVNDFGNALEMGGRLSDLSAQTGEAAGNLLLLERAFDNSGAGADRVGSTINKLQSFLVDAEAGTKKNVDIMNLLGLSYSNIIKMSPSDQFGLISEKISEIENPALRSAIAVDMFGKSGGELLPLMKNFSGEIANARSELGSMVDIMNQRAGDFDTIADKINVIKGKVVEFAAGVIDRMVPALELFSTKMASFDAAGFGRQLADAFLGGEQAMNGFNSALEALKIGEFELSFEIAMIAVELQVKKTFNQIFVYAKSTFEGLKAAIPILMEPIISGMGMAFDIFFLKLEKKGYEFSISLNKSMGVLGFDNLEVAHNAEIERIQRSLEIKTEAMKSDFQSVGKAAEDAGNAWGRSFQKSMETTQPLIDTLNLETELSTKNAELRIKQFEELDKRLKKESEGLEDALFPKPFSKPLTDPLGPLKDSAKETERALGKVVEKVKELTEVEKLTMRLQEVKAGKGVEPLKKEFEQQLQQGRFKQAERTIRRIQNKELEDELRIQEKGERDRRNIADIARAEGIKTFGKTPEEIRKEILEKRKKQKETDAMMEKKHGIKPADKKEEAAPARKPEEMLFDMVKAIKELVEKIEPKLPTHALAL
jgi:hypothetical protein